MDAHDAIERTDWARLAHAYGVAIDTPGHLRDLLDTDPEARKAAMTHLWSAIIHQGTPWTATGPVARIVAGLMMEGPIGPDDPLRADLLAFLVEVAEAAMSLEPPAEPISPDAERMLDASIEAGDDESIYADTDLCNAFFFRAWRGCVDAMPAVLRCLQADLDNASPVVRANAAMGAVVILGKPQDGEARSILAARLRATAEQAGGDERCALVLALGDLGAPTADFLRDASPAVRMCAALAPPLADDAAATDELIDALCHAADMDDWFTNKPPQFAMRPRFTLIARLVARVADFDRLANAAEAVVPLTSSFTVDFDVGPLLAKAFPAGDGKLTSEAQRRLLKAMIANEALWHPGSGHCRRWFEAAGLPYDRQACRALC